MTNDNAPLLSIPDCRIDHPGRAWTLTVRNLQVRRGMVALLTGENMTGKSTLLRMLANQQFDVPASVAAKIGRVDSILSAADDPMFRNWSVRDNVYVASRRPRRREHHERLDEFVAKINRKFNWAICPERPLYSFSTGVRSFVQLARAAVFRPSLYLLDEITPNLDRNRLDVFVDWLLELRNNGTSLIVVSHSAMDHEVLRETFSPLSCVTKWAITKCASGNEFTCEDELL